MSKPNNPPAFPGPDTDQHPQGMTLRDYFAAKALQGFLANTRLFCEHPGCFDKLTRASVVRNINGRDTCLCEFHGRSLSDIRANLGRETPTTQIELKPTRQ